MKKYSFTKMSGAGNDFVIFDKKENHDLDISPEFIRAVCDRRNGVGSDGVISIEDKTGYDFSMEYFNSDGSTGTSCGNGARCAIMFAEKSLRLKEKKAAFLSGGVEYSGEVLSDEIVKFMLKPPAEIRPEFPLTEGNLTVICSFADTGSPHVVIRIEDIFDKDGKPFFPGQDMEKLPVVELGRDVRYSPLLAPKGANVNFIKIDNDKIFIRTYERGVEDETLACGTGSVASAIVSALKYNVKPPVKLVTQSGKELSVDFNHKENKFTDVSLTGPAVITFKGEFFY